MNKTSELFKCFLKLIFNDIKEEIGEYSTENIDKNTEKNLEDDLNSYFEVKEDLMMETLFPRIKYLINYK